MSGARDLCRGLLAPLAALALVVLPATACGGEAKIREAAAKAFIGAAVGHTQTAKMRSTAATGLHRGRFGVDRHHEPSSPARRP